MVVWKSLKRALGTLTKPLIVFLFFATPYVAILADRYATLERGYMAFGGQMLVPIGCFVVLYLLMEADDALNPKRGDHK